MGANAVAVYLFLCVFRVLNALLIQSQFDPDEYWQNLEPAYCEAFLPGQPCESYTWEWKRRPASLEYESISQCLNQSLEGPVRSYASALPTYLFYKLIKIWELDTAWMVSKGPALLNAVIVAAPTDWAVWYMSRWIRSSARIQGNSLPWWCLFCSLVSWFNAYALVRTYSNSVETALLALSLALVSPELLGDQQKSSAKYGTVRACLAFFLGGISSAIRFTSLAAFVPMGFILAFRRQPGSVGSMLGFLFGSCALFGLLGIVATLVVDKIFYGFWVVPFLGNFHFNVILGHGSLFGTHPFHWYLSAGIPAITGLLLPFLLLSLVRIRSWNAGKRSLWIIVFFYALTHSFSEHKEFRFLLPLMPIFCVLGGEGVQRFLANNRRRSFWTTVAVLANLIPVLYLGLFHQRAPIDVNRAIVDIVKHEPQTYTIHYLMGCHSTPLLSHLHAPPVKFETWTLDCSPACRSNPKVVCESDLFSGNPGQFMEDTYFQCNNFEEGTCVTDFRLFYPDFAVVYAEHVPSTRSRILTMGMTEVGRYVHGIKGIRVAGGQIELGADSFISGVFSTRSFFSGQVQIALDEIVLFQSKLVHPHY